jgi:hypothetical protein
MIANAQLEKRKANAEFIVIMKTRQMLKTEIAENKASIKEWAKEMETATGDELTKLTTDKANMEELVEKEEKTLLEIADKVTARQEAKKLWESKAVTIEADFDVDNAEDDIELAKLQLLDIEDAI